MLNIAQNYIIYIEPLLNVWINNLIGKSIYKGFSISFVRDLIVSYQPLMRSLINSWAFV
jgi:hypothetical protein